MGIINIHDAKTHFSKLLEKLSSGEETEIIIAKAGKPLAKLVPYTENPVTRVLGTLADDTPYSESPDCWEPDHELNDAMINDPVFSSEMNTTSRVAESHTEYNAS